MTYSAENVHLTLSILEIVCRIHSVPWKNTPNATMEDKIHGVTQAFYSLSINKRRPVPFRKYIEKKTITAKNKHKRQYSPSQYNRVVSKHEMKRFIWPTIYIKTFELILIRYLELDIHTQKIIEFSDIEQKANDELVIMENTQTVDCVKVGTTSQRAREVLEIYFEFPRGHARVTALRKKFPDFLKGKSVYYI